MGIEITISELAVDRNWNTLDVLRMIAKERGKSVATIAIRWLWQSGLTDVILTGNSNPQELGQNLRAATFSLTEHEMASLTESSELRHPYPNVFYDIFGYRKSEFYGGLR